MQVTLDQETYELVCYAQALMGHAVPQQKLAPAVHRAFTLLVEKLERQKFAATRRPRSGRPGHPSRSRDPRHIPPAVKRAVWERDAGRCTFVSDNGHRCPARCGLEFDHALEVARGGEATVANLRLRCLGHNQFTAERTFGAEFMRHKREEANRRAAESRAQKVAAVATALATASARPPEPDTEQGPMPAAQMLREPEPGEAALEPEPDPETDVTPWLRALGFSAQRARWAAAQCAGLPGASLEERVRHTLRLLAPPYRKTAPNGAAMCGDRAVIAPGPVP